MYKKQLIILSIGLLFACNHKQDEKQKELYVELQKDHEYYQKAQNEIDTNLKRTEEELSKVRDTLKSELGYFSATYRQFDEDLKVFMKTLEEKATSHKEVLLERAVLEDELLNQRVKYDKAIEMKRSIDKKQVEVEKSFELSLSSQDTLLNRANKLINKNG